MRKLGFTPVRETWLHKTIYKKGQGSRKKKTSFVVLQCNSNFIKYKLGQPLLLGLLG